jgi:hypothetical protein
VDNVVQQHVRDHLRDFVAVTPRRQVELAPLPQPVYRSFREIRKLRLKPNDRQSPVVEIEMEVRRLITPATPDVATGAMIAAGPEIDDEAGWTTYRSERPDRRYAVAKRVLSRRQLRRHGVSNAPTDMG